MFFFVLFFGEDFVTIFQITILTAIRSCTENEIYVCQKERQIFHGRVQNHIEQLIQWLPMHKFRQGVFLPPQRRAHANQWEFYDTQKNECLWYLMVSCALHPVPQLQHVCKFQNIGHCPTANAGFCLHIFDCFVVLQSVGFRSSWSNCF